MKTFAVLLTILFISLNTYAQESIKDTLFAASWNLENLFDTVNDTLKNDEEFLPDSIKHWDNEKLEKKLYNLSRVIRSMNEERGPDILGVVEVEHKALLDSMISKFLPKMNYSTAYLESPDNRGIDNGLIYRNDLFHLLSVTGDTIHLPDGYPTRLILGVTLLGPDNDTLHIFVNHWPSRRGGEQQSEVNRITAAVVLKKHINNILLQNPRSFIIIMGDFNDEPTNNSILNTLKAQPVLCDTLRGDLKESAGDDLYNLAYEPYNEGLGTYKYRNDWNMLDQIIVSDEILTGNKFHYECGTFKIYKPDFIVEQTGRYAGSPFPTYGGNRYLGGYSDHFPVTAKFIMNRHEDNK
jgi:endonuclease/exonuclease/phosphatase family metal-dependent hydrolase